MISRKPYPLSKLNIHLNPGQLLDFVDVLSKRLSWSSISSIISLTKYQSHPTIKAKALDQINAIDSEDGELEK